MALTSKQRLLRTIHFEPVDYVPLSFLIWDGLQRRCAHEEEFVERQLHLGIDPIVSLPHLPLTHAPHVEIEVRTEEHRPYPLLRKLYSTPKGQLEAVVEKTPDWPWGDDVPLMDDYIIPRSRKFLITGEQDLAPLGYLLREPGPAAMNQFRRRAEEVKRFADKHQLAIKAPGTRLSDTVCWLCGPVQFATWGLTEPGFLAEIIRIIAEWQQKLTEAYLTAQPDLYVKGEWYATPFLSPTLFSKFLSPALKQEVELVHSAEAVYCYIGTANVMPFLGILKGLGVDALYGVDPLEGRWELAKAKAECSKSICLWGGINGYLQVVRGSPEDVEEAVERAMDLLAPGGGFILSPVDDAGLGHAPMPSSEWNRIWQNVVHMVEAWKRLR